MSALEMPSFTPDLVPAFLERVSRQDFDRFEAGLRSTGFCSCPVRLRGSVSDGDGRAVWSTDGEPDGVLLKACGNRRAAICPTCAERYRQDAYQLFAAGLVGGKGVPDTVGGHPAVFVTLTAPSFGVVHTRRLGSDGRPLPCRPRRDAPTCPHGVRISCGERHGEDDARLGQALCGECYDHAAALAWNNSLGELWRRTGIYLQRHIARHAGLTQKAAKREVRMAYAKVAEYHARGLVHLHVVVRLDRALPEYRAQEVRPPSRRFSAQLLEDAVRTAIPAVVAKASRYLGATPVEWGEQIEVRQIADHGQDATSAGEVAGYLAKYSTKSTELAAGLLYPVRREQVETVPVSGHVREHLRGAFALHDKAQPALDAARQAHAVVQAIEAKAHPAPGHAQDPDYLVYRALHAYAHDETVRVVECDGTRHRARIVAVDRAAGRHGHTRTLTLSSGHVLHLGDVATVAHHRRPFRDREDPRLDRVAHQFGYRGHCLTKSRAYSTTFGALRQARAEHVRQQLLQRAGRGDHAQDRLAALAPEDRVRRFRYIGRGHVTAADAYMAAKAAADAQEQRRLGREARREECQREEIS